MHLFMGVCALYLHICISAKFRTFKTNKQTNFVHYDMIFGAGKG